MQADNLNSEFGRSFLHVIVILPPHTGTAMIKYVFHCRSALANGERLLPKHGFSLNLRNGGMKVKTCNAKKLAYG